MPDNDNSNAGGSLAPDDPDHPDSLRALNRSPHPYHHQSSELPHPSERFSVHNVSIGTDDGSSQLSPTSYPAFSKESSPISDSGTEADDEHFLKGLPAPKARLHKGLRNQNDPISGVNTPMPSQAPLEEDHAKKISQKLLANDERAKRTPIDLLRRNRVLVRRATEVGILAALGWMVRTNKHVSPLFRVWGRGMLAYF